MEFELMRKEFFQRFGAEAERLFVAPARINLIGEHVDYNGGHVFPAAINLRSACLVRRREGGLVRLASTSRKEMVEASLSQLAAFKGLPWGSYQLGVLHQMQGAGYSLAGMDMLFDETVPHGGGLSASAAIELATALAAASLSGETEPNMEGLALLCQRAENEFVGMNCGVMDQLASALGREGSAMLLNCQTLQRRYVPLRLQEQGVELVVINTCKPHNLVTSAYNQRRAECGQALYELNQGGELACLCALTPQEFTERSHLIKSEVCRRRAEHAVCENARTLAAFNALQSGDITGFCSLLVQSNTSLRELYEVTGPELDALTAAALAQPACLGARMMGGGFGGCAIALVRSGQKAEFMERTAAGYTQKTGLKPEFYHVSIAPGAHEVKMRGQ